jgi:hypothetical protein
MTRVVVRLNKPAKIGLALAVAGVVLGLYGRMTGTVWAYRASIPPVVVGVLLYWYGRYRDIRRRRRP